MRVAIVSWSNRKIAGIEDYLAGLMPELQVRGHRLAFAHEVDSPGDRKRIPMPEGAPSWDLSKLGIEATLDAMRAWHPDVLYAHGALDGQFESRFLEIAPAVYFAHNYYGTCISGLKTFQFPVIRPCARRFGPACLLYYLPCRCGGSNPATMVRLYRRESQRLSNLAVYQAVVTHSRHMRQEYIRHGLPESRVYNFLDEHGGSGTFEWPGVADAEGEPSKTPCDPYRLLFVGRMEALKGGSVLLDAMPLVAARLPGSIRLVLAGDGPQRREWERKAARLSETHSRLQFEFTGWLDHSQLDVQYSRTDLLVFPSLWPEPFGRIGLEAARHGVPAAAFAVGGITDWLTDHVNGVLAPADPISSVGLAEAIRKCLQEPNLYERLRIGAKAAADRYQMKYHVDALARIFEQVRGARSVNAWRQGPEGQVSWAPQ
jgi:glycosyltransferase involved in cell wall biosynthesis